MNAIFVYEIATAMKKIRNAKGLNLLKIKKKAKPNLSPEEVRNAFEEHIRKMYWSENALANLLPNLAQMATSYELTAAILAHLAVTENQIIRLIHIFDIVGERAIGTKSDLLEHIISIDQITGIESGYFRDTAIIKCCQQIMDYEVRHYSDLHQTAVTLKEELASEFLEIAVKEEKNAHRTLSEISLSAIYFDAAS